MNTKNITTKIGFAIVGAGAVAMITAGPASADTTRVETGSFGGQGTVTETKQSAAAMVIQSAKPGEPLATGGAKVIVQEFRTTDFKPATDGTVTDSLAFAPAISKYEAIASGIDRIYGKSPESIGVGVQIGRGYIDDPLAPAE